ncbi:GPI mannosyltransferase 2 [Emericellopsis cladophorae]|uniref:GPI mannosyltransferase 2 n=1 Tax=Emericellopsis cladophorae TaxID=2686198 RepID=A0A9P9Y4R4_9HYPO|nr:GPI mannosyltransferase 2 [Emericellopsis cladophorae]KAI6783568.1 GPI mannosyltransferase 2 [Emericellopsis cladophorae]
MALVDTGKRPIASLILLFAGWKAFLLAIALAAAVSPAYDTSTSLFLAQLPEVPSAPFLTEKLTRWDALYFLHASAHGGKVYEQEWAFQLGFSQLVRLVSWPGGEPIIAILAATLSHLGSVLVLHQLTILVSRDSRLAFLTSVLHILSPAGIFLSAPYAESSFAGLSFLGNWLFALGYEYASEPWKRTCAIVGAGAVFGVATGFRSNGLGSGVLFLVEALRCAAHFIERPTLVRLGRLVAPVVGGTAIAAGAAIPQFYIWQRYCGEGHLRPWCEKTVPSIYSFVQEHYWNVGFLRYWTPEQIPLFLLASPVLGLLIVSGTKVLLKSTSAFPIVSFNEKQKVFVQTLAGVQAFIAMLAITNYHVQIVNRLSSAYVVWYWWIASCLMQEKRRDLGLGIVRFFVMYAGIQAGLFSSFLPPA